MQRRLVPIFAALSLILVLLVSACGSSATPTKYRDPRYHYKIKIPSGWIPPKKGNVTTIQNAQSYVVQFVQPSGFRIVVRAPLPSFTAIPDGKVIRHDAAAGCASMCVYHRLTISGFAAIEIRTCSVAPVSLCNSATGKVLHADYVDVNSSHIGYELELLSPSSIPRSMDAKFLRLAESFRIAKHG